MLLVVVLGTILFLVYSPTSSAFDQSQQEALQSAMARTGDLVISVSGSGELVAVSETSLGFEENGMLAALNVKIGDLVQAGDVLASLKIDLTAAELGAYLAQAELDVVSAQQALDQVYETAQLEAANAQLALEAAQLALETLQNVELEHALAQQNLQLAQAAVEEAEMDLYIVNSAPSQQALETAYASLLFKAKELDEIQDQIDRAEYQFKSASDPMLRDRLELQIKNLRVQLANQQVEYENDLYKYETMDDPPEEIDLSVAEARLKTAEAQLVEAERSWLEVQDGPPAGELAMAEAQLAAAQFEWEQLKDGPDPDGVALLEARLVEAELKLETLKAEQLLLDLVAPMDGTVVAIEAQVGDRVGDQAILTLADLSKAVVAVSLDEIDRAAVQIGSRVEISFDVLPERIFHGEVVQISPSLFRVGNFQSFRVWVLLDELPDDLISLPLGVNAVVDVIAGETQDAVLVTIDALHEGVDGSYSVYVVVGEKLEQRPVQVGLMDATTAEIISGLQPGEQVKIGKLDF